MKHSKRVVSAGNEGKDFHRAAKHTLGIIGLGKLGKGILFGACEQQWVGDIHAYSASYGGNYSSIENDLFAQRHKVLFHHTLQGVIEAGPDILFIATGAHIEDFGKYATREELHDRLYDEAVSHLRPVFEALHGYPGLICVMTNPNGDHLYAAHDVFGIRREKLTSFPPDTRRAIGLLGRCLENLCLSKLYKIKPKPETVLGKSFSDFCRLDLLKARPKKSKMFRVIVDATRANQGAQNGITINVVGEHGMEIPLLKSCKVDEISLRDIEKQLKTRSKIFSNPKFEQAFKMELRSIGHRLMKALETTKGSYYTAPNVALNVAKYLPQIVNPTEFSDISQCVYAYVEEVRAFLSVPAKIKRTKEGLEIKVQDEFWQGLSRETKEQLQAQAATQKDFIASKDRYGQERRKKWRLAGADAAPPD